MVERNHFQKWPPGPWFGLWSIPYLDLWKVAKLMTSRQRKDAYKNFSGVLPPGEKFPPIELETTNGQRINTADLLGKKHLVINTGSIT